MKASDQGDEEHLAQRMAALGVRAEDVEESFVRSSGPGGQNVNKTATCVMLRHAPTGLVVKCQETRHQAQNRRLAWLALLERLEEARRAAAAARQAAAEKARRRNRPRSRGAKERILADKARQAAKKGNRRRVDSD